MNLTKNQSKYINDWPYIIANWDSLVKNSRSIIIKSLRRDIPTKYKPTVWKLLLNIENVKRKANFTYKSLNKDNSSDSRIISVDVPRTFCSTIPLVSEICYKQLSNILNAYSNVDPDVGYTQGMNFIAGFFLIFLSEEDAFWCFYSILNLTSFPHRYFFKTGFPKLRVMYFIVRKLVKERFPEVAKALEQTSESYFLFTPQWFLTCFLSSGLEFGLICSIFEQFLAFGLPPLLSFGLCIIDIHKELVVSNFDLFLRYILSPNRSDLMGDIRKVNSCLVKQWITSSQYDSLLLSILNDNYNELQESEQKLLMNMRKISCFNK